MQVDYETTDVDIAEEERILHGQALREAFPDGMYYAPKSLMQVVDPAAGSGVFLAVMANPPFECPECHGTGEVSYYEDVCGDGGSQMQQWGPCPACVEKGRCPRCLHPMEDNEWGFFCPACGLVIDGETGEIVDAVRFLQEQALKAGKDVSPFVMRGVAWVSLPDYDLEIERCNTAPSQPEMWFWQAWRKSGPYPVAGSEGAALLSADEALSDALWMTGYFRALKGAECREVR